MQVVALAATALGVLASTRDSVPWVPARIIASGALAALVQVRAAASLAVCARPAAGIVARLARDVWCYGQLLGQCGSNTALARVCATSIASLLATTPPPPLGAVEKALGALPSLISHSDSAVARAGCSALAGTLGVCSYERVNVGGLPMPVARSRPCDCCATSKGWLWR